VAVLLRRRDRVVVVAVVVLQLLVHQLLHLLHRVYQLQALLVVDLVMLTGMVGRQVVLVRVVLVQGRRGPEDAVTAIVAPELVARIEVLLLGAGVHKHSVTLLAGARPYLSQVLIQSCLSCEDNTAAATFILTLEPMAGIEVLVPGLRIQELPAAHIAGARLHCSSVLIQSSLGCENACAALILTLKTMAGIKVLVSCTRVPKFPVAQIAGARLHFSSVLSQSFLGCEDTFAAFILAMQ